MTDLTPEQWRDKLLIDLASRRPDICRLNDYYRGEHPMPWARPEIADEYRALLRMSRLNWCKLVVKALSERLRPWGLRFADGTPQDDVAAWIRYWQGNRLDAESRMVHNMALIARRGFVLVWPQGAGMAPTITPEHPSQVIVEFAPGNRRNRLAGLKTFTDPVAKRSYCTLWLPDAVYQWTGDAGDTMRLSYSSWLPWNDPARNIAHIAPNPLGEVPLVEFVPDPELIDEPMGELDGGVTDIQDRMNQTVSDRMVASQFTSSQQKWATGLEIPVDPETRKPVEPFKAAVNRMFVNENPAGAFGAFPTADLSPFLDAVEADIQHMAAITRTPPHYLLGQSGAFPSGESLKATETGLVAKAGERIDSFGESWEDVIRLGLKADKDPRANDVALSIIWKDPESHSIAEITDSATKKAAVGVPLREVFASLGYSPTDVERLVEERLREIAEGLIPDPSMPPQLPPVAAA